MLSNRKKTNEQLNKYFNICHKTSGILYKETQIGNALSKTFYEIKIVHLFKVTDGKKNYYVDYYIPDYKIAIEIDEYGHKDRRIEKEIKRQEYIKKKLDCVFIRCNPDDPNFDIFDFLYEIRKGMQFYNASKKF